MYNWKPRNRQGPGPVNVLFWGILGTDPELVGFVYSVNKAGASPGSSHSTEGLAGEASIESFSLGMLVFPRKKVTPCLHGWRLLSCAVLFSPGRDCFIRFLTLMESRKQYPAN